MERKEKRKRQKKGVVEDERILFQLVFPFSDNSSSSSILLLFEFFFFFFFFFSMNGDVVAVESLVQRVALLCSRNDGELLKTLTARDVLRLMWSSARVVQVKRKNGAIRIDAFKPLGRQVSQILPRICKESEWLPAEVAIAFWSLSEIGGFTGTDLDGLLSMTLNSSQLKQLSPTQTCMILYGVTKLASRGTGAPSLGAPPPSSSEAAFVLAIVNELVDSDKVGSLHKAGDFIRLSASLRKLSLLAAFDEHLQEAVEGLSVALTAAVAANLHLLGAAEIRIIMTSFLASDLPCDDLVETLQAEVRARLSTLARANVSVPASGSGSASAGGAGAGSGGRDEGDGGDVLSMVVGARDALKANALKAAPEGGGEGSEGVGAINRDFEAGIKESAARMERVSNGANIRIGNFFEKQEDIASFELGRCKNLIENYGKRKGEKYKVKSKEEKGEKSGKKDK